MRKRKGSFLLVITFGALMAWVTVSMLTVATNLYVVTKDSAKIYSDIQSYRAASELACYQYITDLQGVTVTRDLDADWISVTGQAIYTQALDAIKQALASDSDENTWAISDVSLALSGLNLSDPAVLTNLLGKLTGARQEFSLVVPEPMKLDWDDADSWSDSDRAYVKLEPFIVEIYLSVRGESLFETFLVDGLFLDVQFSEMEAIDGSGSHDVATLMLTEREDGVSITRAQVEVS